MKVYFTTFGCTSNQADTEVMKNLLAEEHDVVNAPEGCDAVVINSCGVIEHTARKVYKELDSFRAQGKKVVLAGCLSKIDKTVAAKCAPKAIISPQSIHQINHALQAAFNGGGFKASPGFFEKPSALNNHPGVVAAIPIAEGCLGSCSYCATRYARGRLRSYSVESIVGAAQRAVSGGCREVRLTAQDTGIWGRDIKLGLPQLIESVCEVPGDFMIRIGMMNPSHLSPILEELIAAYNHEKVFKFLHLPLQSGDDTVLTDMRRGYRVEDFLKIVEKFRKGVSNLTLSTDLIVGYPTEDESAFENTCRVLEEVKPDILNITRFSPRPNTPASRLKDLPDRVKKERSRRLTELSQGISTTRNEACIGSVEEVVITQKGKSGTMLGRTRSYKQVILKSGVLGELKKVTITDARTHYLIGGKVR